METSHFGGKVVHGAMYAMHVKMQIGDCIFGIGHPILKVRSFWVPMLIGFWIYDDSYKVDFCFKRPMEFGLWFFGSCQYELEVW